MIKISDTNMSLHQVGLTRLDNDGDNLQCTQDLLQVRKKCKMIDSKLHSKDYSHTVCFSFQSNA